MASDSRHVAAMFKRFLWTFLVMVPVSAVAGLLLAAVVTYVMPKMYQSEVVIEVKPRHPHGDVSHSMTPQFFGTEFEKIKSRNSLEQVVEKLELTHRWMIDKEAALQVLKRIVTTQHIRGTDLIAIRVRHTNKVDARDIAQEAGEAYARYRREIETRDGERQLSELNKAVRDQEDKVEERRKVLSTIVRTKGIIDRGLDAQDYVDAKRDFETDQELLQTLKLKKISEQISLKTPRESVVIHEDAMVPQSPVSPNVTLNLVLGTVAGLLLSPFISLPLAWLLHRADLKRPAPPEGGLSKIEEVS